MNMAASHTKAESTDDDTIRWPVAHPPSVFPGHRPLFRVPPGTVATGATPEALTAQMDEIQQAARSRRPARV